MAKAKAKFLSALESNGGFVSEAADFAGPDRTTFYEWRKKDPEFADKWDAAYDRSILVLEEEAMRRAVKGTMEPVYQGGKMVGAKKQFSDTLLIFLLKARDPEKYRDNVSISGKFENHHVALPSMNMDRLTTEELRTLKELYSKASQEDPERIPPAEVKILKE